MKITSISIDSFGKLKEFQISLNDGINVVFGKNEQGKSTLMNFIRMMFYGSASGGSDIAKYPRKKYAPWDGSVMSGAIEFSCAGNDYRLEKVFSNSVRTDKTKLFNKTRGENISFSDSREIGRMFFGMGEESFVRSLYIGQAGTLIDTTGTGSSEIISRLQNLVSSGNEDQSYTDIHNRLTKAYEAYRSRSGRIGIIDRKKAELAGLGDQVSLAEQTEREKESILAKYRDLLEKKADSEGSIAKLEKERMQISDKLYAIELKSLMKLQDEKNKLLAEHDEILNSLTAEGKEADLPFIEETAGILNGISVNESIAAELSRQLDDSRKKLDDLRVAAEHAKIRAAKLMIAKKKKKVSAGFFILATIILTGSLLAGVSADPLFFSGIAFAAVCGIIAVIFLLSGKKIASDAYTRHKSADAVILDDRILNTENEIRERETKLEDIRQKQKESSEQIFVKRKAFFDGCDIKGVFARIEELRTAAYRLKSVKTQIESRSADILNALEGRSITEIENEFSTIEDKNILPGEDKSSVRNSLNRNEAELTALRRVHNDLEADIIKLRTEMEQSYKNKTELSELDEKIRRVKAEIEYHSSEAAAIELAREVLKDSFEEMQRSFSPIVNEKTTEIMSRITCGKYSDLSVSKELDVSLRETGGNRVIDWKYLSSGTSDQLYFALRLAVAEFFSEKSGGLPLFFDDPFMQYDDERTAGVSDFIREYVKEKNNQILLFTCHKAILNHFSENAVIFL